MDDDVIHSLGKVLSSVNMVGEDNGMSYGPANNGHYVNHQQQNAQVQQQGGQGAYYGSNSWSGPPVGSGGTASSSLAYSLYSNGSSPPDNTTNNSSLQHILNDSGIYEHSSTPPPQTNDRERKPSIDIFLSQSPSKTLGEEAFRVMHRTQSNPALVNLYPHQDSGSNGSGSGLKPLASTAPSSRSESPQASRSGVLGSGSSPYSDSQRQQQQGFIPASNSFQENGF
jgi:hypothetical protein